ncbi:Fosmidomycin resistance protein [Thalassospira lucentensis]|uniref:Fosmidomycin resistance protein n=1 Tax=Thalassospira lucentensis TaxID=168935 RepID=A0A154LAF8_9PROT|nr:MULTISPECIES: MFS transporter [Thalassospira]KZB68209.1 Fosmidomycin resistance protein [Thalassospira lucentensis]MCH2274358.1 MFS transporter [Thalassospira sp.]
MNEAVLNRPQVARTVLPVLGAASFCHLLNDMIQSLFVAAYPVFRGGFDLSFAQLGLLTLTYQVTASLLQPFIGHFTDRRPQPYSLPFGMGMSMAGLLVLSSATSYGILIMGSAMLGVGSSIFHPESSRLARLASGGAHGFAQSLFQVGGNVGSAIGPLLVVAVVLPHGQGSLAWFAFAALAGAVILTLLGRWYKRNGHAVRRPRVVHLAANLPARRQVIVGLSVLFCLMLSKWFYLASFTSYYVFYLMEKFPLSEGDAQIYLFIFLASVAVGTLIGGSVGDRIGRKKVIWGSILGALPFALILPYVGLGATVMLSIAIGLILSSAFSAIVVYAQELVPGRIGMISGLFFGLAFGLGGIGAAILGVMADHFGLGPVYQLCAWLPAIGFLAIFLPDIEHVPDA